MSEEKKNNVTFELSTMKDAIRFKEELEALQQELEPIFKDSEEENMAMKQVRLYVLTGKKNDEISDENYAKIDELKQLREKAIKREGKYAKRQAEKAGVNLPENVLLGKDNITVEFNAKILEKVPQLKVYTYFIWYTEEEFKTEKEKQAKKGTENGER